METQVPPTHRGPLTLSAVIVNYNVRAFLENALVSIIKAMTGIDGEIIVVDNASDDGSVEMLRAKFPAVAVIANTENRGFAAANNQALARCRGEFVLLLNPDTLVQEDTVQVMLEFMRAHPEAGLAGCKILNPDGTLQLACRRSFPTPWVAFTKIAGLSALFPRSKLFGKYNLTYRDPDATYPVDAVSGSFMLVRKSATDQVGGLDEQFFMYGEDLDWCFRFQEAGWKIYYVHATRIIHYKGESARRSDIDEVRLFYEAMRIFVRKHFSRGLFSDGILRTGIALRESVAFLGRVAKPLRAALLDGVLTNVSLLAGERIWFGEFFHFPSWSYRATTIVPALAVIASMFFLGVYTRRKLSIARAIGGVLMGYVVLSAMTFFFNQYAFSRMVVLLSGLISLAALPGWRLLSRTLFQSRPSRRKSLFGRRTLIVGAERSGQDLLKKLRTRVDDGYEVVGFVDVSRRRIGERIAGVEILGSIDNIGKVIVEKKASEVIFSSDALSFADMLTVIGRTRMAAVNFRLVPSSMEVIIGKTHIDELDDIPLVDIEYNIDRPMNRLLKRMFDLVGGLALIVLLYPWAALRARPSSGKSSPVLLLPEVLRGRMSLVGPPPNGPRGIYLGRPGITGLVQINFRDDLQAEEIEKYHLYYAKNQSLMLDLEILLKSLKLFLKN